MNILKKSYRAFILLFTALILTACGGSDGGFSGEYEVEEVVETTLVEIVVSPVLQTRGQTEVTIPLHLDQEFMAMGIYSDGSSENLTAQVKWEVSDTGIATISNGMLTPHVPGPIDIIASHNGMESNVMSVTISPAYLVSINIAAVIQTKGTSGVVVPLDVEQQFIATGLYSDDTSKDLTSSVTWHVTDEKVATITDGVLTPLSSGDTDVSASYESFNSNSIPVTISQAVLSSIEISPVLKATGTSSLIIPAGTEQSFTALGLYNDGTTVDLTTKAGWDLTDTDIATITDGVLTSKSVGDTVVTASFEGKTSNALSVTISNAELVSIALSPSDLSIIVGLTDTVVATGTYTDKTTNDISNQVTWTVDDNKVATITGGEVSALSVGSTDFDVALGDIKATGTIEVTSATIAELVLSPSSADIVAGHSDTFTVLATYTNSSEKNVTDLVSWTMFDETLATMDNTTATLTALKPGSLTLIANLDGVSSNEAQVTITDATLTALDIFSVAETVTKGTSSLSVAKGLETSFGARATFSDSSTKDVTNSVTWNSSDSDVATIIGGKAYGVDVGTADISAVYDSVVSNTLTLNVTSAILESITVSPVLTTKGNSGVTIPLGVEQEFIATGLYSDLTSKDITSEATWNVSDESIATISEGMLTPKLTGQTEVSATFDEIPSNAISVEVTSAELVSIVVSPDDLSMAAGIQETITATGTYTDGSTNNISDEVTWVITDGSVASITSSTVSGLTAGSTGFYAELNGKTSNTGTITITDALVAKLQLTPATVNIVVGLTETFKVIATYTDGNTDDVSSRVSWSQSDSSLATMDNVATLTALKPGSLELTASLDGIDSNTAGINIIDATVESIEVFEVETTKGTFTTSVVVGLTKDFYAIANFNNNTQINITESATWNSTDTDIATIGKGKAFGESVGETEITASYEGMTSASVNLQVTSATLDSIKVTPLEVTVIKGLTSQLKATGYYNNNTSQDLTDSVSWTSTSDSTASALNGLVKGKSVGEAKITAKLDTVISNDAKVIVSIAELVEITLSPAEQTLSIGQTQQYSATGIYTDGSTSTIEPSSLTWDSSDPDSATITEDGNAKAMRYDGVVNITAKYGDIISSPAILTVDSLRITSFIMSEDDFSLIVEETKVLTVTAHYANGTSRDVSEEATWKSGDISIASVDDNGRVIGVARGETYVFAMLGHIATPKVPVTVKNYDIASIELNSYDVNLSIYSSRTLTATAHYSDGTSGDISEDAFWYSDNDTVTVDAGNLKGSTAGETAKIFAYMDEAQSPKATVTVGDEKIIGTDDGEETIILASDHPTLKFHSSIVVHGIYDAQTNELLAGGTGGELGTNSVMSINKIQTVEGSADNISSLSGYLVTGLEWYEKTKSSKLSAGLKVGDITEFWLPNEVTGLKVYTSEDSEYIVGIKFIYE